MKVIISGFDPFHLHTSNPSQEVVQSLPNELKIDRTQANTNSQEQNALTEAIKKNFEPDVDKLEKIKEIKRAEKFETVEIVKLSLPTCCQKAWDTLQESLTAHKNQEILLILTGLAESRNKISLERFALNIRDYRIADNFGHIYQDELIDSQQSHALRSTVHLINLQAHLANKGLMCEISNHAGTFVCNELYFRCLDFQNKNKNCLAVIFVHFPPYQNYGQLSLNPNFATMNENKDYELYVKNSYAKTLLEIGKFIVSECTNTKMQN